MTYAVQYTISSLYGGYAQKYSVVLYDAARFEALFATFAPELLGFSADAARREYDPFETFQGLMKILKKFKVQGNKPFCDAILRESDSMRAASFADSDATGEFVVRAYGATGICVRGDVETPFDTITGSQDSYRAEFTTWLGAFKDDLMSLLNLCEETIAKDARLVAQTVPNDTPKPAPLIQI